MKDNGERFTSMCSLICSIFPHKINHKVTVISPDGRKENQIDHICISQKFRSSLQDLKIIIRADIGSDNHLLLVKVRFKIKEI